MMIHGDDNLIAVDQNSDGSFTVRYTGLIPTEADAPAEDDEYITITYLTDYIELQIVDLPYIEGAGGGSSSGARDPASIKTLSATFKFVKDTSMNINLCIRLATFPTETGSTSSYLIKWQGPASYIYDNDGQTVQRRLDSDNVGQFQNIIFGALPVYSFTYPKVYPVLAFGASSQKFPYFKWNKSTKTITVENYYDPNSKATTPSKIITPPFDDQLIIGFNYGAAGIPTLDSFSNRTSYNLWNIIGSIKIGSNNEELENICQLYQVPQFGLTWNVSQGINIIVQNGLVVGTY